MKLSVKIILITVSSFVAFVIIVALTSDIILMDSFAEMDVSPKVKLSIGYVFITLFIYSAILCGAMLFFIRTTVLKRLSILNNYVRDICHSGNIQNRLDMHGNDEFGEVAVSINNMISSLVKSEEALKESEERYRALFERAPDSILVIGAEGEEVGVIFAANRAAAEQHGYTVEEMCRLKIFDLNAPETNEIAPEMIDDIVDEAWVTREAWHVKKDGSIFPIEIHAGLVKIKGRKYILGFDRDITVRKLAQEKDQIYLQQISKLNGELSMQAANLAVVNADLESFNYSVSHDMRTPLTKISGYCQLLLEDERLDEQTHTYISRIYESSCWMDELIDAMLDLSSFSRAVFNRQPINLTVLVMDLLNDLKVAEPQRNVEIIVQPNVIVEGDVNLLKIMFTNLLNNAWKYSSHKAKTTIEFGISTNDGRYEYFVRDEGAGFDMKQANKLFRVFTRLHDSSQFTGSGIGLATVHRIIARHGGTIRAEAVVDVGATFFFTLPSENKMFFDINAIK